MKWTSVALAFCGVLAVLCLAEACNEAICASRVSKCMLIKCCECNMSDKKNCTCCRDCQVCLADLYTECCSCVGLCPPPDPNMDLYKTSSIERLGDPIPDLFNVLTEIPDFQQRWVTYTYPRHQPEETLLTNVSKDLKYTFTIGYDEKRTAAKSDEDENKNCTVAFFSQCMSIHKCKASCKSMGAAKYRWFHEYGCCQCVGDVCFNYGLPEPHCLKCPPPDEIVESELTIEYAESGVKVSANEEVKVAVDGL
ncbi:twisted gastrulation protein homolog 1-A-like [Haliotis cracherodii]|uniref:twisted gastrulation protein homolog 1-A-like n=1 Tax=Haliotis cracherodii TaxID=6455 RepID=UPI0039E90428